MTDEQLALARSMMMTRVPAATDDETAPMITPVSFSLLAIDRSGLTVRFVDAEGVLLDLHLNSAVAHALGHCVGTAQEFGDDTPPN